jgi:hypothetical protein
MSNDLWVIGHRTYKVIDTFPAGTQVQHVVPSLRPADPLRGGGRVEHTAPDRPAHRPAGNADPRDNPYNVYFTPDGRSAIDVAEP